MLSNFLSWYNKRIHELWRWIIEWVDDSSLNLDLIIYFEVYERQAQHMFRHGVQYFSSKRLTIDESPNFKLKSFI